MRGVIVAAALVTACGAGDIEEPPVDAARPSDARPDVGRADAPTPRADVGLDAAIDLGLDVAEEPGLDAAPDVAREVGVDAAREVGVDAAREVGVDAARDVGMDVANVPLPGAVMSGAQCYALLGRLGLTWSRAGATMGIVDPVTVTPPINGVNFRYASYTAAVRPMLMDCRLAVALWHLTNALRTRWSVTDVVHLGVYNYRTIAGSTTLSQHAYATAIDLANFRTAAGVTHSVNDDFVMNGSPTCPPRATNARDRLLKEVACWMYDSRVFHIILTPNYNAAHRDHFHVDLTAGSHTVRFELPGGVDPEHHPFFDLFIDDH